MLTIFQVNRASALELITNGDLQANALAGWSTTNELGSALGGWLTMSNSLLAPYSGHILLTNGYSGRVAVCDQASPGATMILWQHFTVPTNAGNVSVSFDIAVNNWGGAGPIVNPSGLTYQSGSNQHARVDILSNVAGPFDTAANVITNLFLDSSTHSNTLVRKTTNLAQLLTPGNTYAIRFAAVETLGALDMIVDNVSVYSDVLTSTNSWIGTASGNWDDPTKWSLSAPPDAGQSVFITNALTKSISFTSQSSTSQFAKINDLTLGAPPTKINTLSFFTSAPQIPLQIYNTLNLQSGGTVFMIGLYGSIVIDASAVNASSNGVVVGYNSQGTLRMNGGSISGTPVYVGLNNGSVGTMRVESGTNSLSSSLFVGLNPGSSGKVWLDGDSRCSVSSISVGGSLLAPGGNGGAGELTVSNATLSTFNDVEVGGYAPGLSNSISGTLTIAGGTMEVGAVQAGVGASMYIGLGTAGNGALWLKGGKLVLTNTGTLNPSHGIQVGGGSQAKALFAVSNGLVQARSFSIGPSARTVLSGGTMQISSNLFFQGFGQPTNLWVSGGDLYVTNAAGTASIIATPGTILLTNGTITTDYLQLDNSSVFTFFDGTLTTKGTTATTGKKFIIGAVTNRPTAGTYVMNGGYHSFSNGLLVAPNALLTGCGTVSGLVTNQGTIAITCPVTFSNAVINEAKMTISNGATVDFYGTVINNGIIDAVYGNVNFYSTFNNNGIFLDATGDADGDGLGNLKEVIAGTNPTNNASTFRILSVAPRNSDMLIAWQAGAGRTNVVQAVSDPGGSYSNISPNLILPGTGDVITNYLDAGAVTNGLSQFYRIQLVP